jgi:hypothetical protein
MSTEDDLPEIEIHIEPIADRLNSLGISQEEFEEALADAIDDYHDLLDAADDLDAAPSVEQLVLHINGQDYPILDLAEVRIEGGGQENDL